jgi:hypothetical protein
MRAVLRRRWQVGALSVYLEPRDAWIGLYRGDEALFWCPVPFLVVRWSGDPALFGTALVLAGLLQQCAGLPRPVTWTLAVALIVPGAVAMWWGLRRHLLDETGRETP